MATINIICPGVGADVPSTFGVCVTWDADAKKKQGDPAPKNPATCAYRVRVTLLEDSTRQPSPGVQRPEYDNGPAGDHRFEFSNVSAGSYIILAELFLLEDGSETFLKSDERSVTVNPVIQSGDPCPTCPPDSGSQKA